MQEAAREDRRNSSALGERFRESPDAKRRKVHDDGLAFANPIEGQFLKARVLVQYSLLAIDGGLAIDERGRMLAELMQIFDGRRRAPDVRHVEAVRRDEDPASLHTFFGKRCLASASRALDDVAYRHIDLLERHFAEGIRAGLNFISPFIDSRNIIGKSSVDFFAAA